MKVYVLLEPVHVTALLVKEGVMVTVLEMGELVALEPITEGMVTEAEAPNPVFVLLFVQL